jgi:hypothetical protein
MKANGTEIGVLFLTRGIMVPYRLEVVNLLEMDLIKLPECPRIKLLLNML